MFIVVMGYNEAFLGHWRILFILWWAGLYAYMIPFNIHNYTISDDLTGKHDLKFNLLIDWLYNGFADISFLIIFHSFSNGTVIGVGLQYLKVYARHSVS